MQPQFISRFLEGQSGVTIKSVSCGDLFTTCMTGWWAIPLWAAIREIAAMPSLPSEQLCYRKSMVFLCFLSPHTAPDGSKTLRQNLSVHMTVRIQTALFPDFIRQCGFPCKINLFMFAQKFGSTSSNCGAPSVGVLESCRQHLDHHKADNTGLKVLPLNSVASLSSLFTVVTQIIFSQIRDMLLYRCILVHMRIQLRSSTKSTFNPFFSFSICRQGYYHDIWKWEQRLSGTW